MVEFPVSGVETWWWLPPLVSMIVSCLAATGGLSGAFLLLPFQVSVLGFTGPGASPTNLFFNVIGTPTGVYRYFRENRMVWVLSLAIILGSLPGMILGAIVRVTLLPDPRAFKGFAALILAFIAIRLLQDVIAARRRGENDRGRGTGAFAVTDSSFNLRRVAYTFSGERYEIPTMKLSLISLAVGVVGGVYGIGGGAIIAPLLVAYFRLPVHTVAGASLFSNFASSLCGIFIYWVIDEVKLVPGVSAEPDWLLGLSLGIGGAVGMYIGARAQRYLPEKAIKVVLTVFLLFVATWYVIEVFRR